MTMTEYYEKYEKLQVEPPELTPALGNTSVKNLLVLKHKRRVSQLKLFYPKLNKKTKKKKKSILSTPLICFCYRERFQTSEFNPWLSNAYKLIIIN